MRLLTPGLEPAIFESLSTEGKVDAASRQSVQFGEVRQDYHAVLYLQEQPVDGWMA